MTVPSLEISGTTIVAIMGKSNSYPPDEMHKVLRSFFGQVKADVTRSQKGHFSPKWAFLQKMDDISRNTIAGLNHIKK